MRKQLFTRKDVSKDRKKGPKMQKNASEECPHKKANEFDERHSNDEDTQFSANDMDKPADVAQAEVLNGDALHPEHLHRTGTEDKSF